jgi:hypothetical protein
MLLSRAEIRLEISATSAASENGSPMADLLLSCQERRLRLLPPSMPWTVTEIVQEQIVLSANVPYASMAEQLANAEIIGRLADLASRAGRWGIVVRLAVPAELSSHPWEAWLRMAVVEGKTQQLPSTVSDEVRRRAESLTLNLVRTGQQAKALTMAQPFADGGVRVTVGETWAGLFGAAWGRAVQRGRLGVGPVAHQLGKDEAVRVLHVIGHPIRTRSGPRIQVATGGFDVSDAMSQTSSRAGAELVGTGDLTQAALRRAGRLVILQAVPSPEVRSREVGRNETTILRSLAAEVSASGVPAVLTLPSLPPDLANSVIQHVARAIKQTPRRWQDDLRPWLSAIERIRKEIATWRPSDSANAPSEDLAASLAELALDVSLSWRDLR